MLSSKCNFLLDNHCSKDERGIGDEYSPFFKELEIISNYLHVIKTKLIIDDLRLFYGVQHPTLHSIKNFVLERDFKFSVDSDALFYFDNRL